ncbi:phosphatase PAP2 family protein [Hyphomonas oceanitis]|uniref:DedA family protein n=1 Tax=Hyphomonas oceanitis SCH89 TaxID=1280953 RepID=A0A059G1U4_9PROT|nr:phosphatase PAP2 family protein [Hyphomonas oceanitis]KDA00827.1 DedA family protein [Hyphomonas oceanitis SCH89]
MIEQGRRWFRLVDHRFLVLLLGAVFTVLAIAVVTLPQIAEIDRAISQAAQSFHTPLLDRAMISFTQLADSASLIAIAIIIAGVLMAASAFRPALLCVSTFLGTSLLVSTIKIIVHRARPIQDLYSGVDAYSFPSGHMTNSTVILGVLVLIVARTWSGPLRMFMVALLAGLIVLVGLSRIYLGAHWPTDVIGGALLGATILVLIEHVLPQRFAFKRMRTATTAAMILASLVWASHVYFGFETESRFYLTKRPVTQRVDHGSENPADALYDQLTLFQIGLFEHQT